MGLSRYALLGLAAATLITAALLWPTEADPLERQRAEYAAFVNAHLAEVNARPEQHGPNATTPSEAAEFEFIRTVDPATRTVPTERLVQANAYGDRQLRQLGAASIAPLAPNVTTAWTERGPDNWGGRTRGLAWDPNVPNRVWAGGVSGGLWYTNDITTDGVPWTAQNDLWENLAITAIAFDPANTQTMYVGTGEGFFNLDAVRGGGLWKSTDGGLSFQRLTNTSPAVDPSFDFVNDLVVTASGTILAATRQGVNFTSPEGPGNGVQRSTDGGMNWTPVLDQSTGAATNRAADLEIAANGDIYASMGVFSPESIWKSTNDGQTWTQQSIPVSNTSSRIDLCAAPSDANTVYALSYRSNRAFKTTDGGANWSLISTPIIGINTQGWYDLICAVDPNDSDRVYAGAVELARTDDGGTTWTTVGNTSSAPVNWAPHPDHHALAFRPGSSSELINGNDGGVFYVADAQIAGNPTFVKRSDGYNVTQFYGGGVHPGAGSNVILGGTQDNAVQRFDESGIESTTYVAFGDGGNNIIDQDDPDFAIALAFQSIAERSFDGGQTFPNCFIAPPGFGCGIDAPSDLFIAATDYDDREDLFFLTRSSNNITRVSSLKPASATPVGAAIGIPGMNSAASAFMASPFSTPGTSTVFVGTTGGQVFRAEGIQPGGTLAVTNITGTINAGYISSIEIGASEQQLLVTVSNYGVQSVYETLDGGANWANKEGNLPDMPVRWATYNPSNRDGVILATESGVWETINFSNASPTWMRAPGFPTVRVDQFQYRPSDDQVVAFTHGRGIFRATFSGAALPVELTAFGAVRDGDRAQIRWETASETNNAGFSVEHQAPGQDGFAEVAFVEGAGTTQEPQAYAHTTGALDLGTHRFRLRQVDLDGSFDVSTEVEVAITLDAPFALSSPFPNPLRTRGTMTLGVAEPQTVTAAMYDARGRRVAVLFDGPMEAEQTYRLDVDARGLSAGTYLVRVEGEAFAETRRLTVVR